MQEAADAEAHRRRIDNARAEVSVSEAAQSAAQDRLARASAAASRAWGWYRDPESFRRQLAEEREEGAAQKRFDRDAASLTRRSDWRTRALGDDQEAVRRVLLAREEERAAADALRAIERNTAGLKEMLQGLLTMG